jgi:putative addiction module component (TIGR02574 family)
MAEQLIASLDEGPDPDIEQAWQEEVQRRLQQIERGEVKAIPWEEVQRRLRHGDELPLEFHPDALCELEQAKQWYNGQRHGLGESFFQESLPLSLEYEKLRISGLSFNKEQGASLCIVSRSLCSTPTARTVCSSLL